MERSTPEIDDGDASSRPTYASGEPRDPGYGKTSLATVAARGIASHAED